MSGGIGRNNDPRSNSRAVLEGPHRAGARAMLRAFGLTDSDFQKPQIGRHEASL